jgi:predicted nucleic acid-binding protein
VTCLYDTTVLVAAVVEAHSEHGRCHPWLGRAASGDVSLIVSAHSLLEVYAVLSTLPYSPRIAPGAARQLVEGIERVARIVALTPAEYRATIGRLAELGITGGAVYDGLIARVAQKAGVDRLVTLNPSHFRRVWPEGAARVAPP